MSGEVVIEHNDTEMFREILIKDLTELHERLKTLDLNKLSNLQYISTTMGDLHTNIDRRVDFVAHVVNERQRIEDMAKVSEARTHKRNTASLEAATKSKEDVVKQ
jgi:hypothetical protein